MKNKDAIDKSALAWMPKSVWGPIKWKELHCRYLTGLPMEGEEQWFNDFIDGLPCPKCRNHFEEYVKEHPPILKTTRIGMFAWTVDAHNHVNFRNGKRIWTIGEALDAHRFHDDPE